MSASVRFFDAALTARLLAGASYVSAAQELGVSARTVRRRVRDPEFHERFRVAQRLALEKGVGELSVLTVAAVRALGDVLARPTQDGAVVKSATADRVLRHALRVREQQMLEELTKRVDELETGKGGRDDR